MDADPYRWRRFEQSLKHTLAREGFRDKTDIIKNKVHNVLQLKYPELSPPFGRSILPYPHTALRRRVAEY